MISLGLPSFNYKTKKRLGKLYILDLVRKKYVLLTPEEWVRQHMLHYLIDYLFYPKGLCRLEKRIYNGSGYYRPDIVLCDNLGVVKMVVECKAPYIRLTNQTLAQLLGYHRKLGAGYLLVTNGITHFCWKWNQNLGYFEAISYMPTYQQTIENCAS